LNNKTSNLGHQSRC